MAVRIYIRVSTGQQKYGLAAQFAEVRKMAKNKGIVCGTEADLDKLEKRLLTETPITAPGVLLYADRAESGGKILSDRPAGARLLNDVRKGDVVLAYCLSRLGRNTANILQTMQTFDSIGVRCIICNMQGLEGVDMSTPIGRFLTTILVAVWQLERENIGERISAGLRAAAKVGVKGGSTPIGFKRAKDKTFKPVLDEQRMAGWFVYWAEDHKWSLNQIMRHVGTHGESPTYREGGKLWTRTAIWNAIQQAKEHGWKIHPYAELGTPEDKQIWI